MDKIMEQLNGITNQIFIPKRLVNFYNLEQIFDWLKDSYNMIAHPLCECLILSSYIMCQRSCRTGTLTLAEIRMQFRSTAIATPL